MFGILIGTLSLIGFVKVWRWGRHGRRGFGGRRQWMFRRLFQHLDTSPGQEKVISAAAQNVERAAWQARDGFFESRRDFARAMRGEQFDTSAVNERFDAQQAAVDEVKKAVREGFQQIHEALTPDQRTKLADLIEFGPARMHGGYACGGRRRFDGGFRHGGGQQAQAVNL